VYTGPLPTYDSISRRIPYERKSFPRSVIHEGQRKLFVSEYIFLSKHSEYKEVHYIGAAPGDHIAILAPLFPNMRFYLYDGLPFSSSLDDLDNVDIFETFVDVFVKVDDALLISDIRSDTSDESVVKDMELQALWASQFDHSLLKFRLPFSHDFFSYLDGVMQLPVWGPVRTTECRLEVTDASSYVPYDVRKHVEKMTYFNDVLRCGYYDGFDGFDQARESEVLIESIINKLDTTFPIVHHAYPRAPWPDTEERHYLSQVEGRPFSSVRAPALTRFPSEGWKESPIISAIQRCYPFKTKCCPYTGRGFRIIKLGSRFYELRSHSASEFRLTPELTQAINRDSSFITSQLMIGRFVHGVFKTSIPLHIGHIHGLFSVSNVFNPSDFWKFIIDSDQECTFCYPNAIAARHLQHSQVQHRIKISISGNIMTTDTGNDLWQDHMVNPNDVLLYAQSKGVKLFLYTFEDFVSVMATDEEYRMMRGRYGPAFMQDPFLRSWSFFSTIAPRYYPWPDWTNTQTWWVKIPTSTLRRVWNQTSQEQREYRRITMNGLGWQVVKDHSNGYYYGITKTGHIVDVSGHAISMLIMAGMGVVDIVRYWDTVAAQLRQALTNKRKAKTYTHLVRNGYLTEDAISNPYKTWHTYWDYYAAIGVYVVMAKDLKYPLDLKVVRMSIRSLNAMEKRNPTKRYMRKSLRAKVGELLQDGR
jgi:hypothetical protein